MTTANTDRVQRAVGLSTSLGFSNEPNFVEDLRTFVETDSDVERTVAGAKLMHKIVSTARAGDKAVGKAQEFLKPEHGRNLMNQFE